MELFIILLQLPDTASRDTIITVVEPTVRDTINLAISLINTPANLLRHSWQTAIKDYLPVLLLLVGGVVTYFFNKKLAKKKLEHDKNLELAKFKLNKELELARFEIQQKTLRFTTYHARKAEVLTHLYSLMSRINRAFYNISLTPQLYQYMEYPDEKLEEVKLSYQEKTYIINNTSTIFSNALDVWNDLKIYGEDNALYLEDAEYKNFDELLMNIASALQSFELFKQESPSIGDNEFIGMIVSLRKIEGDMEEALRFIKNSVEELMKD